MANIKTGVNDEFTFEVQNPDKTTSWTTFKIPQGAYNVTDLNKTIKELITKNNGIADDFVLTRNYNTLRARITLKNILVNLVSPTSIAPLIGFFNENYIAFDQAITYDGELPVNITDVNTILINCSILTGILLSPG